MSNPAWGRGSWVLLLIYFVNKIMEALLQEIQVLRQENQALRARLEYLQPDVRKL